MAIWRVEVDNKEVNRHRKWLNQRGFSSAHYFASNGFSLEKMRQMATEGKLHAVQCAIGKSVRWYYMESQAELARLRGELS
ncbi:hypothetical protein SOV_12210 [Sporomusa ovata DSM 2662]|uniref:Uncharacterized protein n=1 Tax=Sporomusa ovata TaxID=2378 RepID=A0A0U1KXV9_9FIRM|nr:hypothetical protein [Sporomusa ovata]EQB28834.1 hypothetical protein SOV_1c05600 [Sporomusa ovata DSM 2662]CQR72257.1 hypothetical protein SpAn4DRAFT_2717 [Sporomusa ovata]